MAILLSYEKLKNRQIWGPIQYAYPTMPFPENLSEGFGDMKRIK